MIDKNGKVFGKINVIDLIVIIVLVAAVLVFAASKFIGGKGEGAAPVNTVTMEFYTDEVADYVLEHIKVGEPIYDADKDIKIGTVKAFEAGPSRIYSANADGEMVVSEKENYSSVTIVGDIAGELTDYGVLVDDVKYGVGHTFTMRAGRAKIYLKVSDIK